MENQQKCIKVLMFEILFDVNTHSGNSFIIGLCLK